MLSAEVFTVHAKCKVSFRHLVFRVVYEEINYRSVIVGSKLLSVFALAPLYSIYMYKRDYSYSTTDHNPCYAE